jgi:thioredoxin-like negative regulator of GroEL
MARRSKSFLSLKSIVLVVLVLGVMSLAIHCRHFVKEGFSGQKEFVLVHMNGCGHCEKLMPEWDDAASENKTDIKMRAVEMSEGDGPKLCKKHNITGFPTIILLDSKGKKLDDYNGERNKDGILGFLQGV